MLFGFGEQGCPVGERLTLGESCAAGGKGTQGAVFESTLEGLDGQGGSEEHSL